MSDRVYVPKSYAKEIQGQYGAFLSVSFDAKTLIEFVQANTNAKGYFKINVSPRREPDKFGNTHSVTLDTYEPKQRSDAPPVSERKPADDDDVPF